MNEEKTMEIRFFIKGEQISDAIDALAAYSKQNDKAITMQRYARNVFLDVINNG